MELTAEQLEAIRAASREIEYGQITVAFAGPPSNVVDIIPARRIRFYGKPAEPTTGEPVNQRGSGRTIRERR
jgi:hypothetical protein